jgi:hypothetical protein
VQAALKRLNVFGASGSYVPARAHVKALMPPIMVAGVTSAIASRPSWRYVRPSVCSHAREASALTVRSGMTVANVIPASSHVVIPDPAAFVGESCLPRMLVSWPAERRTPAGPTGTHAPPH